MTEYDRGAYTPHADAPLAFDPRSPRERRPIPMTLVASAAILVVLVGAVAMAYRHGGHGLSLSARTVGAPVGAVKTIAAPDAQPKDAASQLDVYAPQNVAATPAFAPAPEQPAPRPAPDRLQMQAAPQPTLPIETTPAAPAVARPVTVAAAAPTAVSRGAADADAHAAAAPHTSVTAPVAARTVVAPEAAPHAAAPHSSALTVATAREADATIDAALDRSRLAESSVAPKPKAKAHAATVASDSVRPVALVAPVKPLAAKPLARKATPAAVRIAQPTVVAAKPAAVAGHGKALVQIGAFGSAAIADAQYAKLSGLTGGHGKAVSAVQSGGKTLYRTSVTGFADRAAASAFCAKLSAAGHACIVKG